MLPINFKVAKQLNLEELLKDHFAKNYEPNSYDDQIKTFIGDLQQNRNVLSDLKSKGTGIPQLKSNKDTLIQYLNQIASLMTRITFGKEESCLKAEFTWLETLKKSNWSSFNLQFEYYNTLFNLGVNYFLLARETIKDANRETAMIKEGTKSFSFAAGIFKQIQIDAPKSIAPNEIPYDLSTSYLDYCINLSLAYGQIELFHQAEASKMNNELQSKLCKGISILFDKAHTLAKSSLSIYIDSLWKDFLENRKIYWESKMYLKLKDETMNTFNKKGEEYGKGVIYQGLAVKRIIDLEKNYYKYKVYVNDTDEFTALKNQEEAIAKEMFEKNKNLYHDLLPDLSNEIIEAKIMVKEVFPTEINNQIEGANALNTLIPKEIKDMIATYKIKMMEIITKVLDECENETTVNIFLQQMNLPASLNNSISDCLSEDLWNIILEVQKVGGGMQMLNIIETIAIKSKEIEQKLNEAMNQLQLEDQEDSRLRNQFGPKWSRPKSLDLNGPLIMGIKEKIKNILQTRQFDEEAKRKITGNIQHFERLMFSRDIIESKIPGRIQNSPSSIKEVEVLKNHINELDVYKNKAMVIINHLFDSLNETNLAPEFMKVQKKENTEIMIFEQHKISFEPFFAELKDISLSIRAKKEVIAKELNIFINNKPKEDYGMMSEKERYKNDLYQLANTFHQQHRGTQKGFDYYVDFGSKVDELLNQIYEFITKRNEEKEKNIAVLQSGQQVSSEFYRGIQMPSTQNPNYRSPADFLNPQKNLITNMGVQGYKYTPPPQHKQQQQCPPKQQSQQCQDNHEHYNNNPNQNYPYAPGSK